MGVEKESKENRLLHIFETSLVPILLGVLAFSANNAANKIADSQHELARAQQQWTEEVTAREEQRKNVELDARLIDLFGQYYFGEKPEKREFAVKIIKRITSPELQSSLALAATEDKKVSAASQADLQDIVALTASDWSQKRPAKAWCYQEDRQTPGPGQFLVACHYSETRCNAAKGTNQKTRQTNCVPVAGLEQAAWNPNPRGYMNSWFQYSDKPFPDPFPQLK
jgi:hypothetical protein